MSNRLIELLAERAGGPSKTYTTTKDGVRKTVMPRKDPETGRLNWRGMDERPKSTEELKSIIKNNKYQLKHGRRGRPVSEATAQRLKAEINAAQTKLRQMDQGIGTKRLTLNKRTAMSRGRKLGRPSETDRLDDWFKSKRAINAAEEYITANIDTLVESFLQEGFSEAETEAILFEEGLIEQLIEQEAQVYMLINEMLEEGLSDEEIIDVLVEDYAEFLI